MFNISWNDLVVTESWLMQHFIPTKINPCLKVDNLDTILNSKQKYQEDQELSGIFIHNNSCVKKYRKKSSRKGSLRRPTLYLASVTCY